MSCLGCEIQMLLTPAVFFQEDIGKGTHSLQLEAFLPFGVSLWHEGATCELRTSSSSVWAEALENKPEM